MPLRPNPNGDVPKVDPTAYVDPSAQLIGHVTVGPRAYVGPNAVLRADEADANGSVEAITIGAESNIQDGVIVHALAGSAVTIGSRTSVAHGAILHGPCRIGDGCFVGFGAVVFKAEVGEGAFVGARAVVEGVHIPPGASVPSMTCVSQGHVAELPEVDASQREFMDKVVRVNRELTEGYLRQLREQQVARPTD
ncbi:MAG: LbetaH domain-containing protein [Planctomycetota bacterium]|jgi:carbonic anhydrase/acetyltransferase-like protein (isoleucine patch superfamily)